jgi:hypothetical protein
MEGANENLESNSGVNPRLASKEDCSACVLEFKARAKKEMLRLKLDVMRSTHVDLIQVIARFQCCEGGDGPAVPEKLFYHEFRELGGVKNSSGEETSSEFFMFVQKHGAFPKSLQRFLSAKTYVMVGAQFRNVHQPNMFGFSRFLLVTRPQDAPF